MKLWLKIAMVAAMTLAILVPLMMIFGVIQERQRYRDEAVADIAANIGQAQTLAGPVLVVPYTETLLRSVRDANGSLRETTETRQGRWRFFPKTLGVDGVLSPSIRKRGLHKVRVYEWKGDVAADFDARIPADGAGSTRVIGQPFVSWSITDVRGLRGTPVVELDGRRVQAKRAAESANSPCRPRCLSTPPKRYARPPPPPRAPMSMASARAAVCMSSWPMCNRGRR